MASTREFTAAFTAHNIRLDDGTETFPEAGWTMDQSSTVKAVKKMLSLIYPGGFKGKSIVDLGCLEGGFATEFARAGLVSTGLDVRQSNIDACRFVQSRVNLPNLDFVCDDAWNVAAHGPFDAVFCASLLYHIDDPEGLLKKMSKACRKVIFIDTHFAPERDDSPAIARHGLGPLTKHLGLSGRWYAEHDLDPAEDVAKLERLRWHSWRNQRSFWPTKPDLLTAMRRAGFTTLLEDYDYMDGTIRKVMAEIGSYHMDSRSQFVGIKDTENERAGRGFWPRRLKFW